MDPTLHAMLAAAGTLAARLVVGWRERRRLRGLVGTKWGG